MKEGSVLCIPDVGVIVTRSIFQVVPGRRVTYLGVLEKRPVVVKVFFGGWRSRRHWRRSDRGMRAFPEKGVLSPGIIFSGTLPQYRVHVLVLEYLDGGIPFNRALEECTDPDERRVLLGKLMEHIAQHHTGGIYQIDLNFGNFMLGQGRIHSIDGDMVRVHSHAIDRESSLRHVARLFSVHLPAVRDDVPGLLHLYGGYRGWDISQREIDLVWKEVRRIRRRNFSKTLGKVFLTRSNYAAHEEPGCFTVCNRLQVDVEHAGIVEASRKSGRGRGPWCREEHAVIHGTRRKLLVYTSTGHGPLAWKRYWRAGRVWRNGYMLSWLGIGAPSPVAFVCRRRGPLRYECSVIFLSPEGRPLVDFMRSDDTADEDRKRVAADLADALYWMNVLGIVPVRLVPEEILVSGCRCSFLGLDGMRMGAPGSRKTADATQAALSWWPDAPRVLSILMEEFAACGLVKRLDVP